VKLSLYFPDHFPDDDLAGETRTFETEEETYKEWSIGRAFNNDIQVMVRRVSRYHCAIAYSAMTKSFAISDLASTYGTQLNQRGLTPGDWEPLTIGSRFSLGTPDLTIVVVESDQDTCNGDQADRAPVQEDSENPDSFIDLIYLFGKWALGGKTPQGKAYRLILATAITAVAIVVYLSDK